MIECMYTHTVCHYLILNTQETKKQDYLLKPQFPISEKLRIKQPAEEHRKTKGERERYCKMLGNVLPTVNMG